MSGLEIHDLGKRYRIKERWVHAVSDVNLSIPQGQFVTVVGKSGCGKTTLLRLICGLERPDHGHIRLTNQTPDTTDRQISIVFQEPRLMPWLTVRQNISFALHGEKDKNNIRPRVDRLLQMLGLSAFQDAYPSQISGGMAQRTALGRTLCFDPDIILMDEPFGALDAFTRRKLQLELIDIFLNDQKTIIFVTHDVDEAILLGQRIVVMENGCTACDRINTLPYPRDPLVPEFLVIREELINRIVAP